MVTISCPSVPGSKQAAKKPYLSEARDQPHGSGYLGEVLRELVLGEVVVCDGEDSFVDGVVENIIGGVVEYHLWILACNKGVVGSVMVMSFL